MEKKNESKNIYDVLLDEENKDPIILVDGKGKKIAFEQIAVIPYSEKLYCILKPIDRMEHVSDDEAIVFYVDESEYEEPALKVETDELKALEVFEKYYDLLDESM
ncbi:MAG: hypothetical protein NC311_07800 [Muribaculaceae bacterium]|nr:hypothetical protein [Muribaculaceae bacterium]